MPWFLRFLDSSSHLVPPLSYNSLRARLWTTCARIRMVFVPFLRKRGAQGLGVGVETWKIKTGPSYKQLGSDWLHSKASLLERSLLLSLFLLFIGYCRACTLHSASNPSTCNWVTIVFGACVHPRALSSSKSSHVHVVSSRYMICHQTNGLSYVSLLIVVVSMLHRPILCESLQIIPP